jgi:RHS repeat-associated protein
MKFVCTNEGDFWSLTDALGSTLALTDSSGALQTSYTYDPFGNTAASGASSTNPFQFTGRENDGTGLYYYRARYYSPTFQRFIAQDPIGFAGGDADLYGYVADEPIDLRDPTGLQFAAGAAAACEAACPAIGQAVVDAATVAVGLLFEICGNDRNKKCADQYYNVDIPTCRGIGRVRGKQAAAACYASAADRYAACLAGRPLLPLNTWNN